MTKQEMESLRKHDIITDIINGNQYVIVKRAMPHTEKNGKFYTITAMDTRGKLNCIAINENDLSKYSFSIHKKGV
jgi:hypothetical protein